MLVAASIPSRMSQHIYIASDMHFGASAREHSIIREKHFVAWLDQIKDHCTELYLLGDVFDFWFEYKHVVPKGYVRLLGKLAELSDSGIEIHIFTGNHDLWLKDYFPVELGIEVHSQPIIREWFGKRYYLAHGDGLGPGDHAYKAAKKVFTNRIARWMFKWLHPDLGIGLARFASGLSNHHNYAQPELSPKVELFGQREWLYIHSKEILKEDPEIDFFIYGHRHALVNDELEGSSSRVIILGDWIQYHSFLEITNVETELKHFPLTKETSQTSSAS